MLDGGRPAAAGKAALRGDRASLRYTRDGLAYLYVGLGEYTLVVGSHDAATEVPLAVHSLDSSIPLTVDLADAESDRSDYNWAEARSPRDQPVPLPALRRFAALR